MHNSRESSRLYSRASKRRIGTHNTGAQLGTPSLDISPADSPLGPAGQTIEQLAPSMSAAPGDLASLSGQHPSPIPIQLSTPSSAVPELQDPDFRASDPNSSTVTFPYSHEPAISVLDPLDSSRNMSAHSHSPFTWNDLIFLDELNQTFGPLNPSTDTHAQLDLLLNSIRGTPAILDEPTEALDHHLDVQRIEQELLRTPSLSNDPLFEPHGGPPLPQRLKKRLDESTWWTCVAKLKSASKVIPISISCLFQNTVEFFPLPRVSALDRYINAYISGLCQHIPFIHLPTFDVNALEVPYLLAICSIGALYCFEKGQARCLHLMAVRLIYQVRKFEYSSSLSFRLLKVRRPHNIYE